jgi:hypothetical protein
MSRTFEKLTEDQTKSAIAEPSLPIVPAQQVPVSTDDGWSDAAAEASSNILRGPIVLFADWKWTKGAEATEVPIGTQWVATGTAAAWVYWRGGKPDMDKTIVRQPGKVLPDREDLGELDRSLWEKGPDEQPRDPWVNTRYVYFLDPVSVEMLTYTTRSIGGMSAVRSLADQIQRMRDYSKSNALPVVELGAAEMKTKFGRKSKPVLKIVRWYQGGTGAANGTPQLSPAPQELKEPSLAEELDDEIPFNL